MNLIFGEQVQDVLTGFTGVVTSRCEEIYGPPSYFVEPVDIGGGRPAPGRWLHEQRLVRRERVTPRPAAAGIGFGEGLPAPQLLPAASSPPSPSIQPNSGGAP